MPAYSVNTVISRGRQIISRHPTYSQPNRGTTMYASQYDCSSFIGVINGVPGCPATPDMVAEYTAQGYKHRTYTGLSNLRKGDVVVWNKSGTTGYGNSGHTAMSISKGVG